MLRKFAIKTARCWTGRRWISLGSGKIAIGFGPNRPIERIMLFGKLVYAWEKRPL